MKCITMGGQPAFVLRYRWSDIIFYLSSLLLIILITEQTGRFSSHIRIVSLSLPGNKFDWVTYCLKMKEYQVSDKVHFIHYIILVHLYQKNCSLSGPSSGTSLPLETLPGNNNPWKHSSQVHRATVWWLKGGISFHLSQLLWTLSNSFWSTDFFQHR